MCDYSYQYGCGGCGGCNQCCEPCYNPYIPQCAPYDCGVTKLVRPIADAQELALYPIKLYAPASVQAISAVSMLLCGPSAPPANPTWETLVKTSICCTTSICQIIPLQSSAIPVEATSGDGVWIDGLDVYINPQTVAECPRSADLSLVATGVTGQTLDADFLPTTFNNPSTKVYKPLTTICFNTPTTAKASFSFKDADNLALFYNIKNDPAVDSGTVIHPSAQFQIRIRYC